MANCFSMENPMTLKVKITKTNAWGCVNVEVCRIENYNEMKWSSRKKKKKLLFEQVFVPCVSFISFYDKDAFSDCSTCGEWLAVRKFCPAAEPEGPCGTETSLFSSWCPSQSLHCDLGVRCCRGCRGCNLLPRKPSCLCDRASTSRAPITFQVTESSLWLLPHSPKVVLLHS